MKKLLMLSLTLGLAGHLMASTVLEGGTSVSMHRRYVPLTFEPVAKYIPADLDGNTLPAGRAGDPVFVSGGLYVQTLTPTLTPTANGSGTYTPTGTNTPVVVVTKTFTQTPTANGSGTYTLTPTNTPNTVITYTFTSSQTSTPVTNTLTPTGTNSPLTVITQTFTQTPTANGSGTYTPTLTLTPAIVLVATATGGTNTFTLTPTPTFCGATFQSVSLTANTANIWQVQALSASAGNPCGNYAEFINQGDGQLRFWVDTSSSTFVAYTGVPLSVSATSGLNYYPVGSYAHWSASNNTTTGLLRNWH